MRALLLAAVGAVFTSLLLVLPAIWGSRWLGLRVDAVGWAAIACPFLVLPFAIRPRHPALGLWAWPASHLPALLLIPGLTVRGSEGGGPTLEALTAVTVAGAAWFIVYLWPARPLVVAPAVNDPAADAPTPRVIRHRRVHPLSVAAFVIIAAITVAFHRAAFAGASIEPAAANVTLLVGAVATWYAGVRAVGGHLADVVLDPQARRRYRATLLVPRRPTRGSVTFTLLLAIGMSLLALAWYLVDPR